MKAACMLLASLSVSMGLLISPTMTARHATQHGFRAHVRCLTLPPGWKEVTDVETGKPYYYNAATGVTQWQVPASDRFQGSGADSSSKRTLSPATTWKVKLDLKLPASASTITLTANLRFAEESGFEPPQGFTSVESCTPEGMLVLGEQSNRWVLSEDPEDRKDSLWIWGLFSEPLYPFIIFEMALERPIEFPEEGVSIPAGMLYFQVDHRRKDGQVQLGEGTITYKVTEKLAADLVGLSEFSYNEPVPCGKIRFLDTAEGISKGFI